MISALDRATFRGRRLLEQRRKIESLERVEAPLLMHEVIGGPEPGDVDQRLGDRPGVGSGAEVILRFRNVAGDQDRVLTDGAHAGGELPYTIE